MQTIGFHQNSFLTEQRIIDFKKSIDINNNKGN